ncbi:MAG TPA: PEP-CTERM sorting domain-containing protein [Luteitalea sp.]|nr:PEP-CTERM sorting domain-containing protein [Luteitalea sp.]
MSLTTNALVLSLTVVGIAANAHAAPMFSTGAGTAVTTVHRSATFDSLDSIGIDLSAYEEGGLSVSAPDTSFIGFDALGNGSTTGFFYGDDGNDSFVTIKATDGATFEAIEFRLGDGYGAGKNSLLWETRLNGVKTGSGFVADLATGVAVGWKDSSGFDELLVAADQFFTASSTFGDFQAIALDDVSAQLANVPEPASLALVGVGLMTLGGRAWRRRPIR